MLGWPIRRAGPDAEPKWDRVRPDPQHTGHQPIVALAQQAGELVRLSAAIDRNRQPRDDDRAPVRPLYDARIEGLGPHDLVGVECVACGHDELIPRIGLLVGLRLPAHMRVLDLQSRFCCRECDRRGSAARSIRWADQ